MSVTVTVTVNHVLSVKEAIPLSLLHARDVDTVHALEGVQRTLNADSTPVTATKVSSGRITLVAGAASLDLTAAPGPTVNGEETTIDFTGLKIQEVQFIPASDNTARVLIAPHATNGYAIFGAAGCQISKGPGEVSHESFNDTLADVDNTHKVIALTSTHLTASVDFLIVGG